MIDDGDGEISLQEFLYGARQGFIYFVLIKLTFLFFHQEGGGIGTFSPQILAKKVTRHVQPWGKPPQASPRLRHQHRRGRSHGHLAAHRSQNGGRQGRQLAFDVRELSATKREPLKGKESYLPP